jgi:pimeloyl-ACP methyl ester carboxylesterase
MPREQTSDPLVEVSPAPPSDAAPTGEPPPQEGPPGPPPDPVQNALLEGPSRLPIRVSSPFQEQGPAPLTVLLHGICNNPKVTCGWFQPGDLAPSWQVCPAGNSPCGRDSYQWSTSPAPRLEEHVSSGLARVQERYGERISREGAVLVGFSLGAFAAVSLLSSGTRRFDGLVLVGASVAPTPEQIALAGVRRVAFAAGDFDSAAPAMRRAAAALEKQGIQARYESLGRTGHVIPDSTSAPIGRLIDWARDQAHAGAPPR